MLRQILLSNPDEISWWFIDFCWNKKIDQEESIVPQNHFEFTPYFQ